MKEGERQRREINRVSRERAENVEEERGGSKKREGGVN